MVNMGLRLKFLLMIINFCLLTSAPVVDQLKEVIDEVDGLHSSNNAEDKYKIHKILEESSQMVSNLIRCTVILVALHFKVRTVSIILSLKLVHCLGMWSLCDLSRHYLHVPEWLICKLFDNTAPTKLWAILEIRKIMLWHCFVERKEWRCWRQKEFIIWRYLIHCSFRIRCGLIFTHPKESMYIYSLIFLVTAAVHAHNNNKVHITKKRVACGSGHIYG